MFIDARKIEEQEFESGVCIIGAGPAGMILALELEERGIPVTILEAGGLEKETANQNMARGDITGRIYYALDNSRLRYFGGCSNHWAGLCRPMDAIDFTDREWVPGSGWPFGAETLAPYYDRARPYINLRPFRPNERRYTTFPRKQHEEFELNYEQYAPDHVLGQRFQRQFKKSKLIKVYLYSNLTDFETDENGRLRSVTARTLKEFGDRTLRFRAKTFVLATGGIENARILLLSAKGRRHALGNANDHVGRYFMEHLHAIGGILAVQSESFPFRPFERTDYFKGYLRLRDEIQRNEEIMNCRMVLEESQDIDPGPLSESIFEVAARMDGNSPGTRLMHVKFISEQAPTRESYVGLSERKDALGQPRVDLHWHVSQLDKKTIDVNLEHLARAFGREGHGRMQIRAGSLSSWKWNFLAGGNHHMGTTRMAATAAKGVVDSNCRMFDVPNLYVAGSSVFPNTGHANPTFTIIALAIRLADRLAHEHRPPAAGLQAERS